MRRRLIDGLLRGPLAKSLACSVALTLALTLVLLPSIGVAQDTTARPRSQPLAVVRVNGSVVRAPDSSHAAHIPVGYGDWINWGMRVDSAPAGVLHSTATFFEPAGANALATIRIPLQLGVLGEPTITTRPRPLPPLTYGGQRAELPSAEAERVATHAYMRQLLEVGALFESAPVGGTRVRRTRYSDGAGNVALIFDALRTSRTLRDTTVSGRQAYIVRDSTAVEIEHVTLRPSRFHKAVARIKESVRGTILGIRLVDAETGRTFNMQDTLALQGRILTDDGLGGQFGSPLVIRSVRQSSLLDAFWQAALPREALDMVRYDAPRAQPLTLAHHDSLFALLDTASALTTRDSIRARLLSQRDPDAPRDSTIWPRVRTRSLTIGDTASVIRARLGNPSIDTADYRVMRAPLADAETAFRQGVDREVLALGLIDELLRKPPVLRAEAETPVCLPEACAAMREDAGHGQPGLQAVGLVASMVTEPRVWTDSVIKYAATNPFLVTHALRFAQGVASGPNSGGGAGARAAIPAPDASYDAWRHWLVGLDSSYVQALRADTARLRIAQRIQGTPRPIQASPQAAVAIRFTQVRTGLDYEAALRRHRDTTSADSARALFDALLIAMGDRRYTDVELMRILLGPMGPERDVAKAQLKGADGRRLFNLPLASDSMATVIGRHLVNMVFADSAPSRADTDAPWSTWFPRQTAVSGMPRYVLMHAHPDAVRARAAELGFAPVERDWQLRPGNDGYLIELGPIRQQGPFVQVTVTQTSLRSRSASRSGGYASGFSLTLVEGPDGWTVVDASAWVT